MAQLSSASLTAVNTGTTAILIKPGQGYYYSISGTFVATVVIRKSQDGGKNWKNVASYSAASSGFVAAEDSGSGDHLYQIFCTAFTSGTVVCVLNSRNLGKRMIHTCGVVAKVGATAGWSVGAAADTCLATVPQSQTASTLVVPLRGLGLGDRIRGFHLIGQIESGGNTVTVDAVLKKTTAAAADVVESSVASITQLSVAADTVMSEINTSSPDFPCVVGDGETYYMLITATTGLSCDIALQGIALYVELA